MNKVGHWGVALLFAAPVAIAIAFTQHSLEPALPYIVISVATCRLPDADMHTPFISHRGITHTLAFAIAVTALVAAGMGALLPELPTQNMPYSRNVIWFYVTGGIATGLVSHLAADLLTKSYHHGLKLFWPISSKVYHLGVTSSGSTTTNGLLMILGIVPYIPLYSLYVL
jgi:inner membrane protein